MDGAAQGKRILSHGIFVARCPLALVMEAGGTVAVGLWGGWVAFFSLEKLWSLWRRCWGASVHLRGAREAELRLVREPDTGRECGVQAVN